MNPVHKFRLHIERNGTLCDLMVTEYFDGRSPSTTIITTSIYPSVLNRLKTIVSNVRGDMFDKVCCGNDIYELVCQPLIMGLMYHDMRRSE